MEGAWVIVDREPVQSTISLLQSGSKRRPGRSARKNLSREQRILLFARLEAAAIKGVAADELVEDQGRSWHVKVVPVFSPYSHRPVGAYGTYVAEGSELPVEPKVGGLEWHLIEDRQIYWDKALTEIYGMRTADLEAVERSGEMIYHPPQEWITQWISVVDQDRIQRLVATAMKATTSRAGVISYTIVHPETGESKVLELCASSIRRPEDGVMTFHGMTREVVEAADSSLPKELPDPRPQIDALIELTADLPLAKIQLDEAESPLQVFPGWSTAGLPNLQESQLSRMLDSRSRERLREIVKSDRLPASVQVIEGVQMRMADGSRARVELWVKPLGEGQIMVRVKPD